MGPTPPELTKGKKGSSRKEDGREDEVKEVRQGGGIQGLVSVNTVHPIHISYKENLRLKKKAMN